MAQALTCRVCGARARALAHPAPWTYARCNTCGTYFVEPMPAGDAVEDADAHYTGAYYSGDARADETSWEQATDASSSARIEWIERALGRKGRLLDVGCGTGYLLAAAKARGWEATGVEVSGRAAEFARRTHDVTVLEGTLSRAAFPESSFDAITLVHVLEHVPNPVETLHEVRRILKPEGLLGIAIPNPRALLYAGYNAVHRLRGRLGKDKYSCSLYPPSHLYAWDERALRRLLARVGFAVAELVVTGKGDPQRYPVADWRAAGRWPFAQHVLETAGRLVGRGSLLEALARPQRDSVRS